MLYLLHDDFCLLVAGCCALKQSCSEGISVDWKIIIPKACVYVLMKSKSNAVIG